MANTLVWKKASEFSEGREPRPAFVGRIIVDAEKDFEDPENRGTRLRIRTFEDEKTGKKNERQEFVFVLEPLNVAWESQDGNAFFTLPYSTKKPSIFSTFSEKLNAVMREITGDDDFEVETLAQLADVVLVVGEVPGKDPIFAALKKSDAHDYRPKNPVIMPVSAPVDGWEKSIPADLPTQKLEAMQRAQQKAADRDATRGSSSGETTTIGAPVAESKLDLGDHEDFLVQWHNGRKVTKITLEATKDGDIKALPANIKSAVVSGKVAKQLYAAGRLAKDGDAYKAA